MKKITVIAYIGFEYSIENLLNSFAKQEIYNPSKTGDQFAEIPEIQLIVVDSVGEESTEKKIRKMLCNNTTLIYLNCQGKNIAECYNTAIPKIQGDYVSFVDMDSSYSPRAMWNLCEILQDTSILAENKQCICIRPIYVKPDGTEKNYKIYPGKNGVCDVKDNVDNINLCLYSYFIEYKLVQRLHFDENFPVESRSLFCIELLEHVQKYYCKNGPSVRYYHALEDAKGLFGAQHHKEWYMQTLRQCFLPFIKKRKETGTLTCATELAVLYLLYCRFWCNIGVSDNEVLLDSEIEELYSEAYRIASYLSYDTLLVNYKDKKWKISSWWLWLMVENKIKYEKSSYRVTVVDDMAFLNITNCQSHNSFYALYSFKECIATVYSIDYEGGNLKISLGLELMPQIVIDEFNPQIMISTGTIEETKIYNDKLCFGKLIGNPIIYQACIPIKQEKECQRFQFYLKIQEKRFRLICNFAKRPCARLTAKCSENYWKFDCNRVLQYQPAKQKFVIEKCTEAELLAVESNFCRAIKMDGALTQQEKIDLIQMRRDYWKQSLNASQRKPIWITYDKLYKAGDNGEYLFHYVRKYCPDIDIYYLITDSSADYERLHVDDHVLVYGTRDSKLKILQAQLILATHMNPMSGCGFTTEGEKRYLKNIYNAQTVCIQHGLTVQNIAVWQNIMRDNTKLYCCASKNEINNLKQPEYGYSDKEIRLTGLARYDGLVNQDKRQILISPTWRRNIVNAGSSGNVRAKNNFFKETEYFRVYNTLINDSRLIENAKKYGYQIIYLIHPTLSSQIDDFHKNNYVHIVAAASDMSYEKILTESSLMITDYSGVQFDFAYMRKPVLYYHPKSLPPHYTESIAFGYETMGFGPIIKEHEELVTQICAFMENNCQMDEFYKKRADDFFAFNDTDNCKRITKVVTEYSRQLLNEEKTEIVSCDMYDFMYVSDDKIFGKIIKQMKDERKESLKRHTILRKAKRAVKKVVRRS